MGMILKGALRFGVKALHFHSRTKLCQARNMATRLAAMSREQLGQARTVIPRFHVRLMRNLIPQTVVARENTRGLSHTQVMHHLTEAKIKKTKIVRGKKGEAMQIAEKLNAGAR